MRPVYVLFAILLAGLLGCSREMELLPVSGQVTLDGKPVEGAAVSFRPAAGGPPATAVTDADGRYTLETANRPGAVPGEHKVAVTKNVERVGQKIQWITPESYSHSETSGLQRTVAAGQTDYPLALRSK